MSEHAFVFAYDVESDRVRARIARLLENQLVRVQKSVFEGRMPHKKAKMLAQKIEVQLGPGDSLRVYALTNEALDMSMVIGCAPKPEKQDFLLFA